MIGSAEMLVRSLSLNLIPQIRPVQEHIENVLCIGNCMINGVYAEPYEQQMKNRGLPKPSVE